MTFAVAASLTIAREPLEACGVVAAAPETTVSISDERILCRDTLEESQESGSLTVDHSSFLTTSCEPEVATGGCFYRTQQRRIGVGGCLETNLHKRLIPYRIRRKLIDMFDFFQDKKARSTTKEDEVPKTLVLTEIVGAMGLARDARDGIDPYVVVKRGVKEVHRTKPVSNDGNPIWTIKTKSLCVLSVPEKSDTPSDDTKQNKTVSSFSFEVYDGFRRVAWLLLTSDQILENMLDQRLEYNLQTTPDSKLKRPLLALRFRQGTPQDMVFLGLKPAPEETVDRDLASNSAPSSNATDMNFKEVRSKNIFQKYKKRKDGVDYLRVMPGPDPDRSKEETEWMTADELYQQALQPSRKWVNAGHGTVGKIYLEILACDNLPCMDISVNKDDQTDPFVGIVFEDNLVRTDMLWDEPNPRWMPWTMRAFCFNVRHPTSLLMLGVFDYDQTPVDAHDPVGRVVINTANFYSNTEYLLRYNLHHDPRQADEASRGSILFRMRLQWTSEVQAMKASYATPPKFIINCRTPKSHEILRYLTRGAVDMEKPSVETVKLYASEVASYWTHYCYFLDVMFEILLWRGRWHISSTKSFWFPLQSVAFSGFLLVSLEYPHLSGAMFFYMLAWSMLSINFHASRHPYPWKRVKRSEETNIVVLTGRSIHPAIKIEPNQGVIEGKVIDRVDEIRGQRMARLVTEFLYFMLKVYRIYSKTTVTAKFFSTPNNEWSLLSGRLYYLHMLLKYLCKYTRLYLALINWQGYYANKLTTTLLLLGTLFLLRPIHVVSWWTFRILAWTLLGPWMKLLDIYFIHRWYKTSHEIMEIVHSGKEPGPDLPDFEALLESEFFLNMSKSGRVIGENAIKLKDMREHVFGHFSEVVPAADSSRFPSVPLPESSARPWTEPDESIIRKEEIHVPGQKLRGTMILKQSDGFDRTEDQTKLSDAAKGLRRKKNE